MQKNPTSFACVIRLAVKIALAIFVEKNIVSHTQCTSNPYEDVIIDVIFLILVFTTRRGHFWDGWLGKLEGYIHTRRV